ncbi:hypothetical protein J437_LFUL008311 [Ladona fulva]|uniref:Alpha-and gamma-adaptin-binding protein p34 n=1 Tax=Ladona fulva TaxID=123851 RepID=A0A8K0NY71_LADFU|nr:hypothetical protein J437_LFUL008311 [Ladona fulva]
MITMDPLPAAVFVSCTRKHPEEIIKLMLSEDGITEPKMMGDNVKAFTWNIDTKYYKTDIYLCSMENKSIENQDFASSVEAVIINFDSNEENGLQTVESWLPFTREFEPEINILLCERCAEDSLHGTSKVKAQEWCVKNGFELVELDPYVASDDEEYELDFKETTGIKRVVQALHAHMWPNLVLKDSSSQVSKTMQNLLNGENIVESKQDDLVGTLAGNLNKVEITNGMSCSSSSANGILAHPVLQESVPDLSSHDLPDNYVDLLDNLQEMKERVQSLPSDQRKAAAEKVVMAFWRALGGDEDEVAGLSDSDET